MLGTKLADRYEIISELGRGGMGVVYRARDPRLNRDVAVKLIPPSQLSPDSEQRFQREAQLVAQMDHPSIVPIYDFGRHDDALFFVMALVQGTNLRAFLRQDSQLGDILDIGIQVAEALDYSHARGVVHRDIKPENIMVAREDGRGVRVRVMDFGLARAQSESRMTRTGTLMGTLGYLSPEQITGHGLDGAPTSMPSARCSTSASSASRRSRARRRPSSTGSCTSSRRRRARAAPPSTRRSTNRHGLPAQGGREAAAAGGQMWPRRSSGIASGCSESDRSRPVTELTRTLQAPKAAAMPFIGRERESAELQQRMNAAIAGESQFVLVGGEPGVGKTRLLDELESLAKARQIRVLHGRSVELDRGLPYQGFLEMILEYFRLRDTGSSPPPDLSDLAPDLAAVFPVLGEVPEIRSAAGSGVDARSPRRCGAGEPDPDLRAARADADAPGRRPSVDPLHGRSPRGRHLARGPGVHRPAPGRRADPARRHLPDHGDHRAASAHADDRGLPGRAPGGVADPRPALGLGAPLVPRDAGRGKASPTASSKRLYKGSEGNPFFTKELVRALVDSGGIIKTTAARGTSPRRRASRPTRCPPRFRRRSRSGSGACRKICATCSRSPR